MIVGAAVVPTAPLLLPDVSPVVPEGIASVAAAGGAALRALPAHDVAVLLAVTQEGEACAVHLQAEASLAGIGRPDLRLSLEVDEAAAGRVAGAAGCRLDGDGPLPLGHTVLAHLRGPDTRPVVPVAVPAGGSPGALAAVGEAIAAALADRRAAVLAAGDLSAGLSERAPLALLDGARAWDDAVVDAVAGGRGDGLAELGPQEAARVGAVGWAPLVVLSAVLRRARLATVVRCYAAPRGVGYLVASAG